MDLETLRRTLRAELADCYVKTGEDLSPAALDSVGRTLDRCRRLIETHRGKVLMAMPDGVPGYGATSARGEVTR